MITDQKCKLKNLKLEGFNYDGWSTEEPDDKTLEGDEELDDLPPLKDNEEVK